MVKLARMLVAHHRVIEHPKDKKLIEVFFLEQGMDLDLHEICTATVVPHRNNLSCATTPRARGAKRNSNSMFETRLFLFPLGPLRPRHCSVLMPLASSFHFTVFIFTSWILTRPTNRRQDGGFETALKDLSALSNPRWLVGRVLVAFWARVCTASVNSDSAW
jgi:hypothetical protein